MIAGVLILSLTMFAGWAETAGGGEPRPEAGNHFPSVMLPSLTDGAPLSIARFRGRKVLLHQFASW